MIRARKFQMRQRGFRPQGIQPSAQHKVNGTVITTDPEAHEAMVEEMSAPEKTVKKVPAKKKTTVSKIMKAVKKAVKK